MMSISTLLHLRFPFSFFLLPVYLFSLSTSHNYHLIDAIITALVLHFLLYPASNGYNSYFDKDEDSIGGLKSPPKVTLELYYTSLLFDLVALIISYYFFGIQFSLMILVYGIASKAYSHPSIRLKKYFFSGWLTIFFFQGYFTFIMAYMGINQVEISDTLYAHIQIPAFLSSVLLGGSYPMTQIYQHEEDRFRGDITLSIKLGILGTFHFTAVMFLLANTGFILYFLWADSTHIAIIFQASLLPALFFFVKWYFQVRRNVKEADYASTMRLNFISSLMLNIFFVYRIMT